MSEKEHQWSPEKHPTPPVNPIESPTYPTSKTNKIHDLSREVNIELLTWEWTWDQLNEALTGSIRKLVPEMPISLAVQAPECMHLSRLRGRFRWTKQSLVVAKAASFLHAPPLLPRPSPPSPSLKSSLRISKHFILRNLQSEINPGKSNSTESHFILSTHPALPQFKGSNSRACAARPLSVPTFFYVYIDQRMQDSCQICVNGVLISGLVFVSAWVIEVLYFRCGSKGWRQLLIP